MLRLSNIVGMYARRLRIVLRVVSRLQIYIRQVMVMIGCIFFTYCGYDKKLKLMMKYFFMELFCKALYIIKVINVRKWAVCLSSASLYQIVKLIKLINVTMTGCSNRTMNIVFVTPPNISGGVATVFHNLYRGLVNEGIQVSIIKLSKGKFSLLSTIYSDILNAKYLAEYDLVLYIGSIPWPSHVLAKLLGIPTTLFLHGYIYHELFPIILYGARLRDRMRATIPLIMFKTAVSLSTIDLYICPSLSVCEANKISDRFILLPNWILPEEFRPLKATLGDRKNSMIRIVAYTSYVNSPRLLNINHLVALARVLERMVKRKFELIIIVPRGNTSSFGPVRIVKPMPRQEFLSLLASADLYIERGIDEDLGQVVLEAMAIGTPVAKLTHQKYWDRQDFSEDDLLLARSFRELSEKVVEYINNIEHYYPYYSKRVKEFVYTKRTWDAVKGPFLAALKHIKINK